MNFHRFKLLKAKTLRARIRGILQILSNDKIKLSLREVGIEATSLSEMPKKINGTRTNMPLVLVQLVETEPRTAISST